MLYTLEAECWLQVRGCRERRRHTALYHRPHTHTLSHSFLFPPLPPAWQKDKHNRLSLGPRTYLELGDFVKAHEVEIPQILFF